MSVFPAVNNFFKLQFLKFCHVLQCSKTVEMLMKLIKCV